MKSLAALLEKRGTGGGNAHDRVSVQPLPRDEPALACLCPNRKRRTRRAPGFDDLVVSPLSSRDVHQKINNQSINSVCHLPLRTSAYGSGRWLLRGIRSGDVAVDRRSA